MVPIYGCRWLLTAFALGPVNQSWDGSSSPSVTPGGSSGRLLLTGGLLVRIQPEEPFFFGKSSTRPFEIRFTRKPFDIPDLRVPDLLHFLKPLQSEPN